MRMSRLLRFLIPQSAIRIPQFFRRIGKAKLAKRLVNMTEMPFGRAKLHEFRVGN
jgi:hypothetical protein